MLEPQFKHISRKFTMLKIMQRAKKLSNISQKKVEKIIRSKKMFSPLMDESAPCHRILNCTKNVLVMAGSYVKP